MTREPDERILSDVNAGLSAPMPGPLQGDQVSMGNGLNAPDPVPLRGDRVSF